MSRFATTLLRKAVTVLVISAAVLVPSAAVLLWRNPQHIRWSYALRAYVLPRHLGWECTPRPRAGHTGPWTAWHRNGQKWYAGQYTKGMRTGKWTWWYDSGIREVEIGFARVPRDVYAYRAADEEPEWRACGLMSRPRFRLKGVPHGRYRVWDTQGHLVEDGLYDRGFRHGMCTLWDEKGAIVARGVYRLGSPWRGSFEVIDGTTGARVRKYFIRGKEVTEEHRRRAAESER